MLRHAEEWIDACNRRDLDRVLQDYAEEASFLSPLAATLTGHRLVEGKAALARYWQDAAKSASTLEFRLDHVVCDTERREMVVVFDRMVNGARNRACEFMRFDENGRQIFGEAMHGAKLD
jgi:ketosteroid isomerase-like protein